MTRDLDIVIWGATGFTGGLSVAYLMGDGSKISSFACDQPAAPPDLRWAVCGRNRSKLEALGTGKEVIVCDADDRAGIEAFVKRTRVVMGMAGPFPKYSDLVVEACAKFGTHWVDISGDVPWSRSLIDRFDYRARANGACIVNQCGYDSIPSDLGTLFAVNALRSKAADPHAPIRSVISYQTGLGGRGGGSLHSAVNSMSNPVTLSDGVDLEDPFLLGGEPRGGVRDEDRPMLDIYRDDALGAWVAPFMMQWINARIVRRSNMMLGYGPEFNYREVSACASEERAQREHKMATDTTPPEVILRLIDEGRLPKPGEGPPLDERAKRRFQSTLIAVNEAGEDVAVTVRGGDAAYEETAKMCTESALALIYEGADCPCVEAGGGFFTPASGLGTTLINRLQRAGIRFDVLSDASHGPASQYARDAIAHALG